MLLNQHIEVAVFPQKQIRKKIKKRIMKTKKNKNKKYQAVWTKCPYCGKTAERIGLFEKKNLIGFLGLNCKLCGRIEKANSKKIDYIQLPLLKGEGITKTLVWRA